MARFAGRRSRGGKKGGLPVTKTELQLSKDLCTASTVADGPSHPKRAPTVRQAMILNYHVLIKKQAALQTELDSFRESDEYMTGPGVVKSSSPEAASAIKDQLEAIQKQISASGGLKVYQQCSDKGGNTSNVLISWLLELNVHQTSRKVRMLEIGALRPDNYQSCASWMVNHPIDLNSRHTSIEEQDFLDRPIPLQTSEAAFDIISCSLVLNFPPSLSARGEICRRMPLHLSSSGHRLIYIVLPLACVQNSRYTTVESLRAMLHSIGYEQIREKTTQKLYYALYRASIQPPSGPVSETDSAFGQKRLLNEGPGRNNFVILLKGESTKGE